MHLFILYLWADAQKLGTIIYAYFYIMFSLKRVYATQYFGLHSINLNFLVDENYWMQITRSIK